MKQSNLEFVQEMRDMLTSIEQVKGPQYAAIVESALNQANTTVGWSILAEERLEGEVLKMFAICDNIINVNVSLMVSLWKACDVSVDSKEREEALYAECQKIAKEIQVDVRMLQKKQAEYSSAS